MHTVTYCEPNANGDPNADANTDGGPGNGDSQALQG